MSQQGYNITTFQFANACGITTDITATMWQIRSGFLAYNRTATTCLNDYLSYSQIIDQIDTYSAPIVVCWSSNNSVSTGHVVAIYGYNSQFNKAHYMDPNGGIKHLAYYSDVVNNAAEGYAWAQTVYNIHS